MNYQHDDMEQCEDCSESVSLRFNGGGVCRCYDCHIDWQARRDEYNRHAGRREDG